MSHQCLSAVGPSLTTLEGLDRLIAIGSPVPFGGGSFTDEEPRHPVLCRTTVSPVPFGGGSFTDGAGGGRGENSGGRSPVPFGGGSFTDWSSSAD